mgnify:CR=1 FL=1
MQVKPSVLQANAICNTQQKPEQGKDGLASWAFDEEKHWWHTRYAGDRESGEDNISKTTRPWIGSGFGQEIRLKKITYTGRTDQPENNHNNIIKYSLYYADMEEPTATPTSSDWVLAKTGYFTSAVEAQDIVLEEAVKATHSNWWQRIRTTGQITIQRQMVIMELEVMAEEIPVLKILKFMQKIH